MKHFFLQKNSSISIKTRVRNLIFFIFLEFAKFSSSVSALRGFWKFKIVLKQKRLRKFFEKQRNSPFFGKKNINRMLSVQDFIGGQEWFSLFFSFWCLGAGYWFKVEFDHQKNKLLVYRNLVTISPDFVPPLLRIYHMVC